MLSKTHRLRALPNCKGVFVRNSMTLEERNRDRDLRKAARDMNLKEGNGQRIYVVNRNEVVKASDIPQRRNALSKNL